jgi:DNA-directed RNA polymerase specialized sigma24 family protein
MSREELARLEADITAELSALKDYRDTEVEVNEMESVDEDISALDAELSFVEREKRRVDPAPASVKVEKQPESFGAEGHPNGPISPEAACEDANAVGDITEDIEDIEEIEDSSALDPFDRLCGEMDDDAVIEPDFDERTGSTVSRLSAQEARLVTMRFGLDYDREYTLEEIATELGLTLEQVREMEARALLLLRSPARPHRLRTFLENGSRGG